MTRLAAVALCAACVLGAGCSLGGSDPAEPDRERARSRAGGGPAPEPPNILLVVTDDQAPGTLARMPFLADAPGFTRFDSFFVNNPLCCPSRATLLTGLYSHHHGVETNLVGEHFDDSSTVATWLDDAGYETGLFGKYLNEYPFGGAAFVPPGWDRWAAFDGEPGYYDYTLADGDRLRTYGAAARDYSTDVLRDRLVGFIDEAREPFFAVYAPYAPHAPRTPAPRHLGAFADEDVQLSANFNRVAAGAPRWWARRPPVDPVEEAAAARGQWESLLAVDEGIEAAVKASRARTRPTVAIVLSDNGYSLGSHRNPQKDCPYEECINVPLVVSWPGTDTVPVVDALVSNVDIAPTIAELAGVEPPSAMDGRSLVPLLTGAESTLGRPVLLRHVRYPRTAPSFWGLRTERWTYAEYETGETELYDLASDPFELRNLAADPEHAPVAEALAERMRALRDGS
jgi:arylsulfatase A-like enzyme